MTTRPPCLCTHDPRIRCDATRCDRVNIGQAFDASKHCRPCWLFLHQADYNRAWGGDGTVAYAPGVPVTVPKPRPRQMPCVHLGGETGERRTCSSCSGHVEVKLRQCAVHGQCTTHKPLDGVRCCGMAGVSPCADYATALPVTSPGEIRHLLYHVYPRAANGGAVWRWNVAKLKRRLNLFNGRRVIGIATDGSTDPASAVREALAGCGCEFIEVANDPALREGSTFHALHERVAEFTGPQHATLWAHAKGITSEAWAAGVRRWTEAMISACFDHWPEVRRLLADHPLVGPFKRIGHRFNEVPQSDWHYSGSFRWFRNRDVFGKTNWRDIDKVWVGVEAWPSKHFSSDESAALIGEFPHAGLALYTEEFWRDWANRAVADWHEEHHAKRFHPLLLTCILVSHRKPATVHEAIASVQAQTTADWQLVVIDSGDLLASGAFDHYANDPRITILASGETPAMRGQVGLQAWCINECVRRGLVRGDLVCYLSDDDVYSPDAFATYLAAARSNPQQQAWYGAAERTERHADGSEIKVGELPANVVGGKGGVALRGRIDGIQVCHRTALRVAWPETPLEPCYADGRFLDALGDATAIQPLPVTIGRHRHTEASTFTRPGGVEVNR